MKIQPTMLKVESDILHFDIPMKIQNRLIDCWVGIAARTGLVPNIWFDEYDAGNWHRCSENTDPDPDDPDITLDVSCGKFYARLHIHPRAGCLLGEFCRDGRRDGCSQDFILYEYYFHDEDDWQKFNLRMMVECIRGHLNDPNGEWE